MTPVRRGVGGVRPFAVAGATLLVAALVLAPLAFLVRGAADGGVAGVSSTLATREVGEALWHTVAGLGDRDTTCAIVGGIVGARVGVEGIPIEWRDKRESLENF